MSMLQTFFFVTDAPLQKANTFVPGKLSKYSLMFVGKARRTSLQHIHSWSLSRVTSLCSYTWHYKLANLYMKVVPLG